MICGANIIVEGSGEDENVDVVDYDGDNHDDLIQLVEHDSDLENNESGSDLDSTHSSQGIDPLSLFSKSLSCSISRIRSSWLSPS